MEIWLLATITVIGAYWFTIGTNPWKLIAYFSALLTSCLCISLIQYQAGCDFGLGDCYSAVLAPEITVFKAAIILLSEISWIGTGIFLALHFFKKARHGSE